MHQSKMNNWRTKTMNLTNELTWDGRLFWLNLSKGDLRCSSLSITTLKCNSSENWCFVLCVGRDHNHATAEFWCYFEQKKWFKIANLEAFAVPLTNNMEVKHCAGQTLYSSFKEKSIGRAYLMGIHAKTKTLGSIWIRSHFIPCIGMTGVIMLTV